MLRPLEALGVACADGRRRFVRDSDGMQQRQRLRKRKAPQEGVSSHEHSDPAELAMAASPVSQVRNPLVVAVASATPCGRVAKAAKLAQLREAAQDQTQLQRWLESRPPARGTVPAPAAERLAAVRRRVAARTGSFKA